MRLYIYSFIILLLVSGNVLGQDKQDPQQTVKGTVVTTIGKQPVIGARIQLAGTAKGTKAKDDGTYRVENVAPGRYTLNVSAPGYEPTSKEIVVSSGRQVIVNFELLEKVVKGEEVVVSANDEDNFKTINESAVISAAEFSIDETKRYAGSLSDPARMAQNFAGVVGASDRRNDIIIRGGSPTELLWRVDGIDVANPNHFANQGGTGGPINAINTNLLDNSDFMTGAFPAEYGNKLSGVFDLHTRRGNEERYEMLAEMGFAGVEAQVEGPIPGLEKSSFIANYRLSTIQFFDALGIDLGFDGVPQYYDISAKTDIKLSNSDQLKFFGLYGDSYIESFMSTRDTVYTGDEDVTYGTKLGIAGLSWQHIYSERTIGTLSLSTVFNSYHLKVDSVYASEDFKMISKANTFGYDNDEGYYGIKYVLSHSLNPSNLLSGGLEYRSLYYTLDEQEVPGTGNDGYTYGIHAKGTAGQTLGYINWNWRPIAELTFNTGLFAQYLDISGKTAIDPRFGVSYAIDVANTVSAGYGIFHQSQPLGIYYGNPRNIDLDFTQATHYILGWTHLFAYDLQAKAEGYLKQYKHAPVEQSESSYISLLNVGAEFNGISTNDPYTSDGEGKTYGAELSLTKRFTDGYYVTATGSYVRQEFTGADGIWRFGTFDNKFIGNLLAGVEWKTSENFSIEFSTKFTYAGGAPYTPIDMDSSRYYGETRYDIKNPYSLRNKPFHRLDLRIEFKNNFNGWSLSGFFLIDNLLDVKNIERRYYRQATDSVEEIYQFGFFPVGGFRIEF
jgi:hypothetical protein